MISCFEIFSIAPTFDLDLAKLEAEYFKAQRQYHPDKFIGKTEQEKMTALQYSMDINQAYKILKNPLKRAQHLLQLQGIIVGSDADSVKPSNDLLMEIMELREHLDEERDTEKYIKLVDQLNNLHKNSLLDILKYYA
ncbi:MAG: Fe-S protein assembly co-chaperone HscB, partial [Rickettsiales bacterium]